MRQNFLLCLRGGNWDTKPARRSHPSFPYCLCHSLRAAVAAVTRHGRRRLSPLWLPLSLSRDFLFPVRLPASPTHRRPWPGSVGGVATRGEMVEASRKMLTGRMAGCPPPVPHLHPSPLPHLSCTDQQWEEKVAHVSRLSLSLPLSLCFYPSIPLKLYC